MNDKIYIKREEL